MYGFALQFLLKKDKSFKKKKNLQVADTDREVYTDRRGNFVRGHRKVLRLGYEDEGTESG